MLRFAPSPTSDMDIGNLRVALFNYIVSKQLNEDLMVIIDDSNKEENIEGKDKDFLKTLDLFSIDYKSVVHQSNNIKYHTQIAMQFLLDKKAFNCFCSDDALKLDKQKAKDAGTEYRYTDFCLNISDEAKFECNAPFTVRIKRPENTIGFKDGIHGDLEYTPYEVDSFVILNQDKSPTYNYATAVDDMIFDISTVIRDEDYLDDTSKQIHIRKILGYDKEINYSHLPKISNIDKAPTVDILIEHGYLPAAIANYLVLISLKTTPSEIFTLEDAIEWFDVENISKDSIEFDLEKLNCLNKEYIKQFDNLRLSKILGYADDDIGKLAKLYIDDHNTIKEIKNKIDMIFTDKNALEDEFLIVKESISKAPYIAEYSSFEKLISESTNLKDDQLTTAIRYVLTTEKSGPDMDKIYPLIKNYIGEIV